MKDVYRRSLVLATLLVCVISGVAFTAPSFSDQNIDAGNLNPTDRVLVQEIRVVGDSSKTVTITSVTVQNLGTAGSGQIDKIEIYNGGTKLGETTNISGLGSGVTINLGGYGVPKGTTHYLKVYITVGTSVSGGETVALRCKFYYQMNSNSYSSAWISDLTEETIRKGGFDQLTDTALDAKYLNPEDEAEVQVAVFTDNDANGNNVLWTQTGSNTIVKVENLGTATTTDIEKIKVTLTINGVDYIRDWVAWAPGSPMEFDFDEFADLVDIPDNSSVTVTVEMKIQDQGSVTDGHTIRTRVSVLVREGTAGSEVEYEQTITSSTTQTIRKQGFEAISEESTSLVSGTMTTGSNLEQIVKVTDDDVNNNDIEARQINIRNLGTASGDEIHQIQVKAGATTLVTITHTQPTDPFDNFNKAGMTILFTIPKTVDDDESQTIKIYYEIGTPVDGHTLQPIVKVQGREPDVGGTDYWSDGVTYPDSVALYQPGSEIVENITPPEGGTAYSSQRLLAQKIRLVDRDENDDNVTIHPVVVKNIGSAQANPDVTKIEVWRKDTEGGEEWKLGEATDLAGLRTGGVTIPILQDNVVIDKPAGSEAFLYIYVTIADPEDMVPGRTLQLETRVLHTETSVGYDKMATSNQWTLAINHRPVVDFTYEKATGTASIGPKADFTYEDTIKFHGTATDPDGDAIDSWHWDFGDGNTSTAQNPTHQYPNGGTFDVTLTAMDARGVSGSKTKTITVEGPPNEPPQADFTWAPDAPDTNEAVTFTATVTDPDQPTGTPFTYAWDFGDGTTSAASSPQHAFTEKKAYTVILTVTDAQDAETTVTKTLSVGNEPPVAVITAPATAKVGEVVAFSATVTDPDQPAGTAFTYAWDFGDEATSSAANPTHIYTTAKIYTVSLVVTDDKGTESAKVTKNITVTGAAQVITYSYPNPAATQASIVYYLPIGATDSLLRIYNLTGALIHEKALTVGESPYVWNLTSDGGADMPNGLYFCVITAKDASGKTIQSAIFKLLVVR
jgi:PKD repeat protein